VRIELYDIGRQRLRVAVQPGERSVPPLLLFNGIGASVELVQPFFEALDGREAIVFDVPGVGGSPTPAVPYRPHTLATLAARLLNQLGHAEVDVLGVSWGGVLAQQFAFQHSTRCRRMVLAATSAGHLMVPGKPSVLLKMATPRRYRDPGYMERVAGDIYGGVMRQSPEVARRHLRHVHWSSDAGYYLQLAAVVGWTSLPWLPFLKQPALVMAGADDPLVPAVNGRILAALIPKARLVTIEDGHLFLITSARESGRIVSDFLN
jgi:poly(3-hydroxyalkanoate) depolymerase